MRQPLTVLSLVLITFGLSLPAVGQSEDRPIAIFNARVDGHAEPVTILISQGKIRAVAAGMRQVPMGVIGINAEESRVVPGRIDVGATLAAGGDALGHAIDGFDPYDDSAIQDALRNGVTTVVLVPEETAGLRGQAAVIKLKPGATVAAIDTDVAFCAGVGLGKGVVQRASEVEALYGALRKAKAYEAAGESYQEELAEYEEALKKRAEGGDGKQDDGKQDDGKQDDGKQDDGKQGDGKQDDGKQDDGKKDDGKKEKGPKPPKRPRVDRTNVLLLRVLKGELPLLVVAHRAADLVSALELRDTYPSLRLVLEGATEAHLLADLLARADVPVILGPALRSDLSGESHPARARADSAALLSRAGVEVLVAGGVWPRSRSVELNAQAYVQAGWDPAEAESALTTRAAALIGMEHRLGRIAVGYDGDLVILRKGSLGVETPAVVIVDGRIVFGGRK